MTNSRTRLLRWASGIIVTLGAGHLALLTFATWAEMAGWAGQGLWAAVPLDFAGGGAGQAMESLRSKITFWAGPGGFAVPLIILGALIWHLAGREVRVPAGVGWALGAWCLVGGVLLVPSPFFAGVVSGVLIIVAARKGPAVDRAERRTPRLAR
jgi:hypothetical protein